MSFAQIDKKFLLVNQFSLKYIRGAKLNFMQERLGFDEKAVSEEKLSTVISEIETEMQCCYQKVKNIIYETALKALLQLIVQ